MGALLLLLLAALLPANVAWLWRRAQLGFQIHGRPRALIELYVCVCQQIHVLSNTKYVHVKAQASFLFVVEADRAGFF